MGEISHLTPQDMAYLTERARIERENAEGAGNPRVAAIHAEMAEHYESVLKLGTRLTSRAVPDC